MDHKIKMEKKKCQVVFQVITHLQKQESLQIIGDIQELGNGRSLHGLKLYRPDKLEQIWQSDELAIPCNEIHFVVDVILPNTFVPVTRSSVYKVNLTDYRNVRIEIQSDEVQIKDNDLNNDLLKSRQHLLNEEVKKFTQSVSISSNRSIIIAHFYLPFKAFKDFNGEWSITKSDVNTSNHMFYSIFYIPHFTGALILAIQMLNGLDLLIFLI